EEPTHEELAQATGLDLVYVEEALSAVEASVSLNQTIGSDGDGEFGDLFADQNAEDPSEEAGEALRRQFVRNALGRLPERERRVLELRLGFDGESTSLEQIGRGLSMSRELEDKLLEVRERFDRVLEEWVPDEDLREQWREYIHNRRPEPDGPAGIEPLVFQGVTDAGSVLQVRGQADEYEVRVDGSLQERIAARKDLSADKPVLHFRWDGKEIAETFNASGEALTALAEYRDDP